MKKIHYLLFSAFIALTLLPASKCEGQSGSDNKVMADEFMNIPQSVQTSVYWYWISDHLSEEGVVKDLQSMKEAGINRAFIGNIGLSENEAGTGKIQFNTEEWWKIVHTALKTATELGIEIGIFNSPGWSQSGGPWVKPEQAMRYLDYTKVEVEGGKKITAVLPKPENSYKDSFQDVKVLAFPIADDQNATLTPQNATVTASPNVNNIKQVLDSKNNSDIVFASQSENGKEVSIDFKSNNPFTLRSVKIYAAHTPINCPARIQAKVNNEYQTLAEFAIDRYNFNPNVGFDPFAPIVIATAPTTATDFRLVISNINAGAGLRNVELSTLPYIERYPEKTLAKMFQTPLPYWNEYQWRNQPDSGDNSLYVDPAKIIDLSDKLKGDNLEWDAPEGKWMVMRMGMLPTGVTNAPARPVATGLEIDKMSKKHVEAHFEAYMGEIIRRIPAEDRKCWKVVVQDSYETGGQNFTDDFLSEFKTRYGYDPVPFLPVYSGVIVENEDISNRFLWDMRRLVADKVAYDYVGGLRDVSHKYGLTTWLENYGHWGFPGEFLQYGGQSDEIGGEFWSEGSLGDIENRAASSCGHIYGKTKISAESFTAGGGGFHRYPAMMKQRGDRFFTEGINNTLLHVYITQPYEDLEPGVNAPFGNEFNRKNTWFSHMDLFTSYLKRANYMLQQGLNVADVAYFIGEDAPKMTGVTDPQLPKGYQFDYINAEVILRDATVKDGMLTLPHGTQYRILVLPKLETMRPEVIAKIEKLINEGAVVLGPSPKRSPSYENYPAADKLVLETADRLWSKIDTGTKFAKIGKGMLIDGLNLSEAMALINCVPDCKLDEAAPILYGHRKTTGAEIYFVSNQDNKTCIFTPEFRVKGMQPELWDTTSGKIRTLPAFEQTETGTKVPLALDCYESAFIVFREKASSNQNSTDVALNFPKPVVIKNLENPWTVTFDKQKRGPEQPVTMDKLADLTTFDNDDIKYYSGTIKYNTSVNLPKIDKTNKLYLNLNSLSAMAKVKVNDKYVGGVWTAPYRIDVSDALKDGDNAIEIEITTTWVNRLIGDLKLPENERKTWVTFQPWNASSTLQQSGLIGPVEIESIAYK